MSIQVQHRRDTRATILTKTPAAGELGYATDTLECTIGDGATAGGAWIQKKNFSEVLAPASIGASQNDYAPASYTAHTGILRVTSSAAYNITGLTGGTNQRVLSVLNAGTFAITLKDASGSSAAANRFSFGADVVLSPKQGVVLFYDGTNSLWYAIGSFLGSSPLLAANNLSDVASVSTARTNLGLGGAAVLNVGTITGTVAAGDDSRVTGAAQKSNNLSDLTVAATARTNLGLGTAATQNTGTSGANVPLLNGANTWSGAQTISASLSAGQDTYLNGVLSPASLSADQNDFAPSGIGTTNVLRVLSSVNINITGLTAGTSGRIVALVNVGNFNVTLKNLNGGSAAANRFSLGADLVVAPNQGALLIYDATSSLWRAVAVFAGAAGLLAASNNLSDVGNVITARANLGAAASGANGDITSLAALAGINGGGLNLRGYLAGLTLSNDSGTPNTILDIAAGGVAADDASLIMTSAAVTKTTGAWAVGSGNGALDTGTVGNSLWYHVFQIMRTDTSVVDKLLSLSHGNSATATVSIASPGVVTWTKHGLQVGSPFQMTTTGSLPTGIVAGTTYFVISSGFTVDTFQFAATQGGAVINTTGSQSGVHTATAGPVMPASYTKRRRIGSIKTDGSSNILAFTQYGREFIWKLSVGDVNDTGLSTTTTKYALTVPIGVPVNALFRATVANSGVGFDVLIQPLDQTAEAAGSISGNFSIRNSVTNQPAAGHFNIRTNAAAQIQAVANGSSTTFTVVTYGWVDDPGRQ